MCGGAEALTCEDGMMASETYLFFFLQGYILCIYLFEVYSRNDDFKTNNCAITVVSLDSESFSRVL